MPLMRNLCDSNFHGQRPDVHYFDASGADSMGFGQEETIKEIWAQEEAIAAVAPCKTSLDCQLNGDCLPNGKCRCRPR